MAAVRPTSVRDLLSEVPHSLRSLSQEHCDGWGLALRRNDEWTIERSTECAARCCRFAAGDLQATLAIAHVRKKTVGELSLANTHPFRRGRFVFAHNGTVATDALVARTAPEHLAAIVGTTDSEKLFAFVLTHIDQAADTERGIAAATRELHALEVGIATFLISNGTQLYAHRFGRELFIAQRDGVALIASEPLGDDRWDVIADKQLVVVEPVVHAIAA
jgi:glutamine amidotransferase